MLGVLSACASVHQGVPGAHSVQRPEEVLYPLELELQTVTPVFTHCWSVCHFLGADSPELV